MKCPDCWHSKCVWIKLKDPRRLSKRRLERVISHNTSFIEMTFRNGGGALAEERAYAQLTPYVEELERRNKL